MIIEKYGVRCGMGHSVCILGRNLSVLSGSDKIDLTVFTLDKLFSSFTEAQRSVNKWKINPELEDFTFTLETYKFNVEIIKED